MRASASAFCLIAVGVPMACHAQSNYPNKAIRLVSPYAPGGGTDILARLIGQKLSEAFGQPVVVENRPGAGGTIGTEVVARSAPDGYTIMIASPSPIVVAPHLTKKLGYEPLRDLVPITSPRDCLHRWPSGCIRRS